MLSNETNIRIVLSGGGTGGSVTPLLAISEELSERYGERLSMMWIGTHQGIERALTARHPFIYKAVAAGKLRRYFDLRNITDIFKIIIGLIQSVYILYSFKPQLVVTAGSFLSVPVAWAAWILNIPVIVHQQDIRPGLANLLMAPCAKVVTVAFGKSLDDYGSKSVWIGNPVRKEFKAKAEMQPTHVKSSEKPLLVILGGGTGSQTINSLVLESVGTLTPFLRVIHITGRLGRWSDERREATPDYQFYELLESEHLAEALADASLVVTRAGLGTLSELSYLGKPCIIIPIPDSHQEENAEYFASRGAAVVLDQRTLSPKIFSTTIKRLLNDKDELAYMSQKIKDVMKHNANKEMADIIDDLINR